MTTTTNLPLFDVLDGMQRDAHAPFPAPVLPGNSEPPVTPDPSPEERRDKGIKAAVEHADAVELNWSERADIYVRNWLRRHGDDPFLMEDVVADAKREGFPDPPDGRAFGGVIRKLARDKAVIKVGYALAASSNRSPKCQWQRNPDWNFS